MEIVILFLTVKLHLYNRIELHRNRIAFKIGSNESKCLLVFMENIFKGNNSTITISFCTLLYKLCIVDK